MRSGFPTKCILRIYPEQELEIQIISSKTLLIKFINVGNNKFPRRSNLGIVVGCNRLTNFSKFRVNNLS